MAPLTIKEVSHMMYWSVSYLSDIERGRRAPPQPEMIRLLADVIGPPDGLLALASIDRGRIEIPMTGDELADEVAIAMSIRWGQLSETQQGHS
jgi:transcriptional regulator with XRE-family HTH domain